MTLSSTTLADELKAMGLFDNEPDAVEEWAEAYKTYMEEATSNLVDIMAVALVPAKAAMVAAMSDTEPPTGIGLSTSGATAIQAGTLAFWGAIIPSVAWTGVTAITPPVLLSGLATILEGVFTANKNGSLSKNASMNAIAAAIHANSLGGTATWPTPVGPQSIL